MIGTEYDLSLLDGAEPYAPRCSRGRRVASPTLSAYAFAAHCPGLTCDDPPRYGRFGGVVAHW
eukprot:611071-Rhodomonas_salina.2